MEKPKLELLANNCFTIVVLPEPDGAEKIMSLPSNS
jgi:hypothetical protein